MARKLIVVTGANRGFGRCVAVETARQWPDASLLLSSRAGCTGMDATVQEVQAVAPQVRLHHWHVDMLSPVSEIEASARDTLTRHLREDVNDVLFVHNAATLGTIDKTTAYLAASTTAESFHVNVTAFAVINSIFLELALGLDTRPRVSVVNVSSLCGVQPFEGFGTYCAGKAARDMMMKVAAVEYPHARMLSYAPGPMPTAMMNDISQNHFSDGVRRQFRGLLENSTFVCPSASARELAKLLDADTFESGAHIDYYDLAG